MNSQAARAAEIEASFLAGVEHNLNQVKEQRFRGTKWLWASKSQEDRVRQLMAGAGRYDRELLKSLPRNAARVMTCIEPHWLLWEKPVAAAVAACLSPIDHLVREAAGGATGQPAPVDRRELTEFVRFLVGLPTVPHLVGICSTSGFTEDLRKGGLDLANVNLVLVEPRPDGGWTTFTASPNARAADARLFDPEASSRKMERIREEVQHRRADLLTGGLSASAIGSRLGVPVSMVGRVFENLSNQDRELRVSWQGDDVLLYLGAPASVEDSGMSMVEWIRQLFSGEGEETRKINALTERRARLASRRDRLYEDLSRLEGREADLLGQGREAASPTVKRRVASQIKQLRDDMGRLNAAARMVGQQIDVISTHVHNLTLIQQGQSARLPSSEEITQDAVRAEELLEQLGAEVELASGLGGGVKESGLTDDELEILKELESPGTGEVVPAPRAAEAAGAEPAAAPDRGRERREPQAG